MIWTCLKCGQECTTTICQNCGTLRDGPNYGGKMRRESKKLSNDNFQVKIMAMDLASVLQEDCEVSLIIEEDKIPIRFDIDINSKKITVRYQSKTGFESKTYTVRQFIEHIKADKRK